MAVLDTVGRSLAEAFFMLWDTLWALVLGFVLSGAVQAFARRSQMQRMLGNHRPRTVATAGVFGMLSSSCSYAASALAKSLFLRGADFTSAMVFMFASTNLVVELGAVLWLLLGWQFALAEFVGGFIMIALLAVVLPRVVDLADLDAARARLRQTAGEPDDGEGDTTVGGRGAGWRRRIRSRAGWSEASGYTVSDVTMLRKELLAGFVIAGFASMAVPTSVWQALFWTGHGLASTVENVVVGPFLAFISFVCSVGNVPLGAALWQGGISFGGVIAFIFADLLALPLVLIYRRFYGTRLALRLSLVFWAVMSVAGLLTELVFSGLGLVPDTRRGQIAATHIGLNTTTVLNVLALAAFGYLYWLYRNATRFGGGHGFAKDVVCSMQVRTDDAPARTQHAGSLYYFCSDRCLHKFQADPDRYARGDAVEDMASGEGQDTGTGTGTGTNAGAPGDQAVDPVCGMDVDVAHPGARANVGDRDYVFCSTGCRDAFTADPAAHLPGVLR